MKNRNISLIAGLSLPVLLILVIAFNIYWPRLWMAPPKTNFIYALSADYYPAKEYFVENSKIAQRDKTYPNQGNVPQPSGNIKLFLHDVATNKSREVTFEEAQRFKLDGNYTSPDGFQISYATGGGDGIFSFLFYSSRDYNSHIIKKDNYSRKLDLAEPYLDYSYYYNRASLIGWVIQ